MASESDEELDLFDDPAEYDVQEMDIERDFTFGTDDEERDNPYYEVEDD